MRRDGGRLLQTHDLTPAGLAATVVLLGAHRPDQQQMLATKNDKSEQGNSFGERWHAVSQPGSEQSDKFFTDYLDAGGGKRRVLNCAITPARARELTRFTLPDGVTASDCLVASVTGNFPDQLQNWSFKPKIRAVPQLPQMKELPGEYRSLGRLPWFERATPAGWLGINARHLRYNWELWNEIKPKRLQGVFTTLILGLPQIAFAFTPHIQLEKSFLFLGAIARGLGPAQLFPTRYLYPEARLGGLAPSPAPIFADVLPATGGFAYPVVDCEPDPWRVLARFGNIDRYYGYPFRQAGDGGADFTLQNHEHGAMLLPNGQRVSARVSESRLLATLDPELNQSLLLDRDAFAAAQGLLRGNVTHDGLPFNLPVEVQALVLGVVLTHWNMELDLPGELDSYALSTRQAAIGGFNYYQRVEPYFSNFMRLVNEISGDPNFCCYPLSTHLTHSWLQNGNLQISNQLSRSEQELGPNVMRAYYHQQLSFQLGVTNLANQLAFRSLRKGGRLVPRTGAEIEQDLDFDGLAFHQMHRLLRFDSHLFPRPRRPASPWPSMHPGFFALDRDLRTESLTKL